MRIRTKMMMLISAMVSLIIFPLALFFLMKSQTVLLENTLATCRLLAENISNVARDEFLLKTYEATRNYLKPLSNSKIRGLKDIYVIHADGHYVADLRGKKLNSMVSASFMNDLKKLKKLNFNRYSDANNVAYYRFTNPIFIITNKKEKLRAGTVIITFKEDGIFAPLKQVRNSIIIISFILFIISLSMTYLLSKVLSNPIKKISYGLDTLTNGKYGFQVNMKQGGEWGKLANNFNSMSMELLENAKKIKTQAAMESEMNIARSIQMNMLPKDNSNPPYNFLGFMKTADKVGGDYYDYKKVSSKNKDYWWFVIGDVSGHGLPAGLVMLMAQTALHSTLDLQTDISPVDAYNNVNKILYSNIQRMRENKYMTATFFRADDQGNFLLAGLHTETLIYRKKLKELEIIPSNGMWLGMLNDISDDVKQSSFKLNVGDTVLIYTDGLTETMNINKKMFALEGLMDCFSKSVDRELSVIKEIILTDLYRFRGEQAQFDDISFALIRREN